MENDPVYQAAMSRIAANQAAQERLVRERHELEVFVAKYVELAKSCRPVSNADYVVSVQDDCALVAESKTVPRGRITESLVLAAMDIIADNKRPMKLGAIYDAMTAKGIDVPGKEPRNNLGAKLSADRRLCRVPRRGWWFSSESIPADYEDIAKLEILEPHHRIDDHQEFDVSAHSFDYDAADVHDTGHVARTY